MATTIPSDFYSGGSPGAWVPKPQDMSQFGQVPVHSIEVPIQEMESPYHPAGARESELGGSTGSPPDHHYPGNTQGQR